MNEASQPTELQNDSSIIELSLEEKQIAKELKDLTNITESGEQHCFLIAQELLHNALKSIEDQYYNIKCVPFSVNSVVNQMLNLVDYIFMEKDKGEQKSNPSLFWTPGQEPSPVPIDSWARSCIPVLIIKKTPPPGTSNSSRTDSRTSKRTNSARRSRRINTVSRTEIDLSRSTLLHTPATTTTTTNTSANYYSSNNNNKNNSNSNKNNNNSSSIIIINKNNKSKKTSNRNTIIACKAGVDPVQLKKAQEQELLLKKRKEEEEEEKKNIDKFLSHVRGKDYTYDSNGEIIFIKKIDPNSLPTNEIKPKYSIVKAGGVADGGHGNNSIHHREEAGTEVKEGENHREEGGHVTYLAPPQPMIDKLKPVKGVTLKIGKKVIRGEKEH